MILIGQAKWSARQQRSVRAGRNPHYLFLTKFYRRAFDLATKCFVALLGFVIGIEI